MGLPGCLFVCHLILLLMCFLFNLTTQVTITGNVGSVDVFRAAHLFTFGPRG